MKRIAGEDHHSSLRAEDGIIRPSIIGALSLLIKANAFIDDQAESGNTGLHNIVTYSPTVVNWETCPPNLVESQQRAIDLLLAHGACPLMKNKDGKTALELAALNCELHRIFMRHEKTEKS